MSKNSVECFNEIILSDGCITLKAGNLTVAGAKDRILQVEELTNKTLMYVYNDGGRFMIRRTDRENMSELNIKGFCEKPNDAKLSANKEGVCHYLGVDSASV